VKRSTPVHSVDCWLPVEPTGLCPVQWGKKQKEANASGSFPGVSTAPLLFLFYINEVAEVWPDGVSTLMYVDDVTLFTQDRDKTEALSLLQTPIDHVAEWSKAKKMRLSTDKSEVTFFSSDNCKAAWIPSASLNGIQMPFNPNPKLLGIYLFLY